MYKLPNPKQRAEQGVDSVSASDLHDTMRKPLEKLLLKSLQSVDLGMLSNIKQVDQPKALRWLDNLPQNSLRIPFLHALFPDALFIYIRREAKDNISSIMDGWKPASHITQRHLPNWDNSLAWSYVLPENWQALKGKSLAEIAAFQYTCLLYTSPSPRDQRGTRMPSSA